MTVPRVTVMYDIYAVLITVGCFAFTYVLIRVLGRV
jgi:hypothetical protein